ncbi:MAG: hypothetical protein M0Z95_07945 [Actinomycetota bacterium]|jgi:DhnA family fructose-bisphosphate aldolase class Ia|nr:hypothetical protein [Actinomycetota bacterium]
MSDFRGLENPPTHLPAPALVLAADHRARGVITIENYQVYLEALAAALPHCDGILASMQPLCDLAAAGHVTTRHRTYLSVNRTGLAGSAFELDDRLVASVAQAAGDGWSGVKHMTRIDRSDPRTATALELLGKVLAEARAHRLEAMVEPLVWKDGAIAHGVDDIVYAAVIAHDLGAPLLKLPVPDAPAGAARQDAVARVVASVGVPVLFLGGPRTSEGRERGFDETLGQVADVMAGGGSGMAIGRTLYEHPTPAEAGRQIAAAIHQTVTGAVDERRGG